MMFPAIFVMSFIHKNIHISKYTAPKPSRVLQMSEFWSYTQLKNSIDHNTLSKAVINPSSIITLDNDGQFHKTAIFPNQIESVLSNLISHHVDVSFSLQNSIASDFLQAVPYLVFGFIFVRFIFPMLSGQAGQAQYMMKMGGKINPVEQPNVTFTDVAGCDESKAELEEVVDFLKNPDQFINVGAKIPRGVLLEGPPGTGKTLLAQAVSGESNVPFISISGSDFVEMYVGLGASRVRQLFASARENAPCIVFIDEIDAVGKKRSSGPGGLGGGAGNDEREQTLNQILSEMDGFDKETGVIVVAATNRADMLDAALLRPGRFDRKVPVPLPDVNGRKKLFAVHSQNKPIGIVDFDSLSKQTIGFSGADISNIMNEACIGIVRSNKTQIDTSDIEEAIEKVTVGIAKQKIGALDAKTAELVAYHEAGHALVGHLVPGFDEVSKISILPRIGGVGGFTQFLPSEERLTSNMYTREYLESQLCVCMGGRAAEEIIYGKNKITTGASSDLRQAKNIAMQMVSLWGFGNGLASWGDGTETPQTRRYNEEQASEFVNKAYEKAIQLIEDNKELLEILKIQLLQKEILSIDEIKAILD